jgi:hypothetical protein
LNSLSSRELAASKWATRRTRLAPPAGRCRPRFARTQRATGPHRATRRGLRLRRRQDVAMPP